MAARHGRSPAGRPRSGDDPGGDLTPGRRLCGRARLRRPARHPVPDQPLRRGRLPRRGGGHDHRIGHGAPSQRADPAVRRVPGLRSEPDRAADPSAVGVLAGRRRGHPRQHARLTHRVRHRGLGRPPAARALRALPAHPDRGDRPGRRLLRPPRPVHGLRRPPPAGGADVHQLPGRRHAHAARAVPRLFAAGAVLWSMVLVFAGQQLGVHWEDIRHALQPFDLLLAVLAVLAVVLFVWWRLGRPGWRRPAA